MMETEMACPVPPQYSQPVLHDFRAAATGPRGYLLSRKRKLEEVEELIDVDTRVHMEDCSTSDGPPVKRARDNTVGVGKASGRPWKEAGVRANTLRNPILSTSWEKKMELKAQLTAFKAAKSEVIETRRKKLQGVRKQREDAKKRKEENKEKSLVTQKITKTSTVKRMLKSKKQRKLLRKADTTVVQP